MSEKLLLLPCVVPNWKQSLHMPLSVDDGKIITNFSLKRLPRIHYFNVIHLLHIIFGNCEKWFMDSLTFAYATLQIFEQFYLASFLFRDNRKHARIKCICSSNLVLRKYLPATSYVQREQWVVEIGENEYLGLTTSGPRILSAEHWAHYCRLKMLEWSKSDKDQFKFDNFTRISIENLNEKNKLNLWTMRGNATINLDDFIVFPIPRLILKPN